MHRWAAIGLCAGALGALLPACVAEQKPPETAAEFESRAAQAYSEALIEFLDQNWEYAAQLMQDVQRNYGTTPYARLAELRLADIAFRQERYPEAAAAYKAYAHDHPNDAEVPYARYRVLRSHFLSSSNNVFQPPLEERDLANVRDAYVAIRAFMADYPDYKEQDDVRYMLESTAGMLVRHELYVARFYANRDQFSAAVLRVQYALRTYQDSGLEPEGIVLLGEIYLKLEQPEKARGLFEYVIETYPASAFCDVAKRFLEHTDQLAPRKGLPGAPSATSALLSNRALGASSVGSSDSSSGNSSGKER